MAAGNDVESAVAVHVADGQAFMLVGAFEIGRFAPLLRLAADAVGVDVVSGHTSAFVGSAGTRAMKSLCESWFQKTKLLLAVAEEIACRRVMMFCAAALLDNAALPWRIRIEVGRRIFPPPDLIRFPVSGRQ